MQVQFGARANMMGFNSHQDEKDYNFALTRKFAPRIDAEVADEVIISFGYSTKKGQDAAFFAREDRVEHSQPIFRNSGESIDSFVGRVITEGNRLHPPAARKAERLLPGAGLLRSLADVAYGRAATATP